MIRSRFLAGGFAVLLLTAALVGPVCAQGLQNRLFLFAQGGPEAAVRAFTVSETGSVWIGVAAREADPLLREHLKLEHGLVVDQVMPEGPAAAAGVKPRDLLLQYGERKLRTVADLVEAVAEAGETETEVKLLRAGEPLTVTIKAASRPETPWRLPVVPPDAEAIKKWLEQWPGRPGEGPWEFRVLRPGMLLGEGEAPADAMPENLSIVVTKTGKEPAKIVVRQNDEQWETTADKLDALPAEIRPHVERLLGRGGALRLRLRGDGERPFEFRVAPPAAPETPPAEQDRFREFERQMQQRMEEMNRRMEELRRELQRRFPAEGRRPARSGETDAAHDSI